jgi:hypothetical protein
LLTAFFVRSIVKKRRATLFLLPLLLHSFSPKKTAKAKEARKIAQATANKTPGRINYIFLSITA